MPRSEFHSTIEQLTHRCRQDVPNTGHFDEVMIWTDFRETDLDCSKFGLRLNPSLSARNRDPLQRYLGVEVANLEGVRFRRTIIAGGTTAELLDLLIGEEIQQLVESKVRKLASFHALDRGDN